MKFQAIPLAFQTFLSERFYMIRPTSGQIGFFELLTFQTRLLEGAHSIFDIKLPCFQQAEHRNLVK